MALRADMQSQKREASNFYSSPLIQAEEKIQSGNFEPFLSHLSVWGAKTFVTRLYFQLEANSKSAHMLLVGLAIGVLVGTFSQLG